MRKLPLSKREGSDDDSRQPSWRPIGPDCKQSGQVVPQPIADALDRSVGGWIRSHDHGVVGIVPLARQYSGTFEHEVDGHLLPKQFLRVAGVQCSHRSVGDHKVALVNRHWLGVTPISRIEAQQICMALDVGQVVCRDHLQ